MQLAQADDFKFLKIEGVTTETAVDAKRWSKKCKSQSEWIRRLFIMKYGSKWYVYAHAGHVKIYDDCNDKIVKLYYIGITVEIFGC